MPPAFTEPTKPAPCGKRCRYIKWAELLRLTFGLTVDVGRHEQPTRGPQPPGVACPANAKSNMAYTHLSPKSARRLSLAPMHRPFTTAEPARQPLLGTVRDGSIRLRTYVTAMKTVDATIKIVGPDLSWHYIAGNDWLTPILQGCGDLFDVVAIHRYPFNSRQSTLEAASGDATTFATFLTSIRSCKQPATATSRSPSRR